MKKLAVIIIAMFSLIGVTKIQAQVAVGIEVGIAPPILPYYDQPPCPFDGYIWTPGYWAWGPDGYYWVPGVWVEPPEIGFLWTPGWWGFDDGYYHWHYGYWGPHVGFYGGVCYGWGYGGEGYYGGRWEGGHFRYNTYVSHVNSTVIHNTYVDRNVSNSGSHASFNGKGGVSARPTAVQQSYAGERHVEPTSAQTSHEHNASTDRNQLASVNKGHPTTAAMNSVNGQRFNSGGHAVSNSDAKHSAPVNNTPHNNASRPQAQHNAAPSRNNNPQPQHSTPATHNNPQPQHQAPMRTNPQPQRSAPPMRSNPQPQRSAPPMRSNPQPQRSAPMHQPGGMHMGGGGGGGHMGGGGGGGHMGGGGGGGSGHKH